MATTVIMPQLGETVAEGKILTWLKSVGDDVKPGDKLFEVETDKVTIEVEAIAAGKLSEIRIGNGVTAKVGSVVAVIGGESAVAALPAGTASPATSPPMAPFAEVATPLASFGKAASPDGLRFTPLARRIMAQNGVDARAVANFARAKGQTKICERDIRQVMAERPAVAAPAAPPPASPVSVIGGEGEVITLNTVRTRTGERLAENWRSIPHVFQAIDIDFTAVEMVRARRKERFKAETGASLTYLPFIARATCLALQAFPQVNGRFDGKTLFVPRAINLGIAVDLAFNGLVVPVVRQAGDLTLAALARAINRQIDKARGGKLTPDDFAGGTYSITNNGAFGTSFTAPIINAPQVAILSIDAIRKKPAVVSTPQGDFIAPRLIGTVGQCFDHRAFDGAYSAAFLSKLRDIIETRDWDAEFN
jgi:pyruvate/2-oxoglutarate dehydrogenase complex dihydrolipoamide acyltransferase (E2) component